MIKLTTAMIVLVMLSSCQVFAQDPTPQASPAPAQTPRKATITQRQIRQQARIRQGVRSGALTPAETRRLEAEQRKIAREKRAAKADGMLTTAERAKIRHDQNKASRDIYRKKHNVRTQ